MAIFVTHSSHFLAMSDHIIAMESDGTVVTEGSYDEIISMPQYEKYATTTTTTTTAGGSSDELSSREDDKAGPSQSKESEPEDAMVSARQAERHEDLWLLRKGSRSPTASPLNIRLRSCSRFLELLYPLAKALGRFLCPFWKQQE